MLSGGSEAEVSSTVMLNSHNIHTEDAFSAGSLGDLHPNGNDGQTHPQTQAAVSSSGNSIPVNAVPIVSYSGTPDMNSVPHQQNQFQGNSMFLSQTATVVTPVMVSSNISGYDQGLNQLVPASVIVNTQPRATEGKLLDITDFKSLFFKLDFNIRFKQIKFAFCFKSLLPVNLQKTGY